MIRYKASNLWTRSSDKDLSTGKPVDRNRINLNIVLHGKDDSDQCPVAGAEFPDGVVVNKYNIMDFYLHYPYVETYSPRPVPKLRKSLARFVTANWVWREERRAKRNLCDPPTRSNCY